MSTGSTMVGATLSIVGRGWPVRWVGRMVVVAVPVLAVLLATPGARVPSVRADASESVASAQIVSAGISADAGKTCATREGRLACWGTTPTDVIDGGVIGVALGGGANCALLQDHTLECWGYQVGSDYPRVVPSLSDVRAVTSGGSHLCALLADGTIRCWGDNHRGQLGDGTLADRTTPTDVVGITNAVAVAAGQSTTCAVLVTGSVECWGDGYFGQRGDGSFTPNQPTPLPLPGITDAVAISAGDDHMCALGQAGVVSCWGDNASGAVGAFGGDRRVGSPHQVGVDEPATGVAAGGRHTCALLASGAVECWGNNQNGQLGDGTHFDHLDPQRVSGITNALAVTAGGDHTCALLANHDVACWGLDPSGVELTPHVVSGGPFTPNRPPGDPGPPSVTVGSSVSALLIDDARQHVLVATTTGVRAFDFSLRPVGEVRLASTGRMTIHGSDLFVVVPYPGAVDRIDLDTLVDRGPIASGLADPLSIAFAGGRVWTSVTCCGPRERNLVSIDPNGGDIRTVGPPPNAPAWDYPELAATPTRPDTLFVLDGAKVPASVYRLDVSTAQPTVDATNTISNVFGGYLRELGVSPDGNRLIPGAALYDQTTQAFPLGELDATTLQPTGVQYPDFGTSIAVATSPALGGLVVTGDASWYDKPDIRVFAIGNPNPVATEAYGEPGAGGELATGGLAISADGQTIFAVGRTSQYSTNDSLYRYDLAPPPDVPEGNTLLIAISIITGLAIGTSVVRSNARRRSGAAH